MKICGVEFERRITMDDVINGDVRTLGNILVEQDVLEMAEKKVEQACAECQTRNAYDGFVSAFIMLEESASRGNISKEHLRQAQLYVDSRWAVIMLEESALRPAQKDFRKI